MSTENLKTNILLLPFYFHFSLSNEPRENRALSYTPIRLWNWEFGDHDVVWVLLLACFRTVDVSPELSGHQVSIVE